VGRRGRPHRPAQRLAFGTDTFADFTGVAAEPHLSQLRHWAATGEVPGDGASVVADLSKDEVTARLHFRLGAEALRQGKPEAGRRNLERAGELAPYDWTIRRAAMPLLGEDPFGQRFLDLYDEWQDAGAPTTGCRWSGGMRRRNLVERARALLPWPGRRM